MHNYFLMTQFGLFESFLSHISRSYLLPSCSRTCELYSYITHYLVIIFD